MRNHDAMFLSMDDLYFSAILVFDDTDVLLSSNRKYELWPIV